MNDTSTQYEHKRDAVQHPDVGVQDQFRIKKPNRVYSYDSSLGPALRWEGNRERELGKWLIGLVARCAAEGEAAVFQSPQVWKGEGAPISKPFVPGERHHIAVKVIDERGNERPRALEAA